MSSPPSSLGLDPLASPVATGSSAASSHAEQSSSPPSLILAPLATPPSLILARLASHAATSSLLASELMKPPDIAMNGLRVVPITSGTAIVRPMPTKPTLPQRPRPPDLRYVKNEAAKALRVQQHAAELAAYHTLKAQYDEELYPAYHAEQKRILQARQRQRDGRQPRGPPPVAVGFDPLADAAVPSEVLNLVQRMCDHF